MTKLVTVREMADQIGVHYRTALDYQHTGEIPFVNIATGRKGGHRWRIAQRDIDRFLESRRTAAA